MNQVQRKVLLDRGYLVGAQIGKGTFGTVFQCTDVRSYITYAVKVMDLRTLRMRSEFQESRLMREVQVMRQLNHPFIVRLQDVIFSDDAIFLIMELVIGVDLFDTIVAKGGFDEMGAKFLFCQLCLALAHMHRKGILHRDVKPENILLRGPQNSNYGASGFSDTGCIPSRTWIKLVDFGLSKLQSQGDLNSFVGTPRYIAPEVITVGEEEKRRRLAHAATPRKAKEAEMDGAVDNNGDDEANGTTASRPSPTYSTPADCFSAGICLFVMMANCFPKFQDGEIIFEGNNGRAAKLSAEAKDLILRLTEPDPAKRMTMEQALAHPWLAPAKELVDRMIISETSIVSVPKSLSNSPTSGSASGRPLKRPFLMINHQHQSPYGNFATVMPSSSWNGPSAPSPVASAANTPFFGFSNSAPNTTGEYPHSQLGIYNPNGTQSSNTNFSQVPQQSSFSGSIIVAEIEREWRSARQADPMIYTSPDVVAAKREIDRIFLQSKHVVLKCAGTGLSVLELIPDIRAYLDATTASGEMTALESIKGMLDMIKSWIDSLKQEANDTLQANYRVLTMFGAVVQQIALSPDVVAESIAAMAVSINGDQTPIPTTSRKCLSHLERIDVLLRQHYDFWGRLDSMLNALQQKAAIIENMHGAVAKTPQLADRFYQKLDEYFNYWQTAALLSQQFNNNIGTSGGSFVGNTNGSNSISGGNAPNPFVGASGGGNGIIPEQQQTQQQPQQVPFAATSMMGGMPGGVEQPHQQQPHSFHLHGVPVGMPASKVVVTNETTPTSSLESYDGDI